MMKLIVLTILCLSLNVFAAEPAKDYDPDEPNMTKGLKVAPEKTQGGTHAKGLDPGCETCEA